MENLSFIVKKLLTIRESKNLELDALIRNVTRARFQKEEIGTIMLAKKFLYSPNIFVKSSSNVKYFFKCNEF